MSGAIQIRRSDVTDNIRKLAKQRRRPITDVVAEAVQRALQDDEAEFERKMAAVDATVKRFNALPVVGPMLTDADLYDEDGLPI